MFRRLIKFLILKIDQVLNKLWVQNLARKASPEVRNYQGHQRLYRWREPPNITPIENVIYENEESSPFTPEWIIALNMSFEETDKNAISGREPLKYNPENGF